MKTRNLVNHFQINQKLWNLIDFVLPPTCIGCGIEGVVICSNCEERITRIPKNVCKKCGKQLSKPGICQSCIADPPAFFDYRGYGYYQGVLREAIIQLKYHRNIGLANVFSNYLIQVINSANWKFDVILPVPLSENKKKERGFNQAYMIARPVAFYFNKPCSEKYLIRIKENQSQVNLGLESRKANVKGAFLADQKFVTGKRILLIDDVYTTGSTLREVSHELVSKGAAAVLTATIAKTLIFTTAIDVSQTSIV